MRGLREVEPSFLSHWLRAPQAWDHKYTRGVVGFVTGSQEFPGAALLGIEAALRTGVGMVRYSGPESVAQLVLLAHPEVVITPGPVDAWVIGSGMASPLTSTNAKRIESALSSELACIVDAGALELTGSLGPLSILTPHSGELATLYDRVLSAKGDEAMSDTPMSDTEKALDIAMALQVTVLVKGSITMVVSAKGTTWQLPPATPWLATAGMGDALAGIMGALVASWHQELKVKPELLAEVAVAASLLHNLAALEASALSGGGPITVGDLSSMIPRVVQRILSQPG